MVGEWVEWLVWLVFFWPCFGGCSLGLETGRSRRFRASRERGERSLLVWENPYQCFFHERDRADGTLYMTNKRKLWNSMKKETECMNVIFLRAARSYLGGFISRTGKRSVLQHSTMLNAVEA